MSERLQKAISRAGLMSRRAAEELIAEGHDGVQRRTGARWTVVRVIQRTTLEDVDHLAVAPHGVAVGRLSAVREHAVDVVAGLKLPDAA